MARGKSGQPQRNSAPATRTAEPKAKVVKAKRAPKPGSEKRHSNNCSCPVQHTGRGAGNQHFRILKERKERGLLDPRLVGDIMQRLGRPRGPVVLSSGGGVGRETSLDPKSGKPRA